MRKSAFFLIPLCLILIAACGRTTNLPTHALDNELSGETRALMLTQVAFEDRIPLLESFMSRLPMSRPVAVVAYGERVPGSEVRRMRQALLERGLRVIDISTHQVNAGDTLGIVFGREHALVTHPDDFLRSPRRFDEYWFSSAAVSPNFGASTEANLAAQAARPGNLIQPAPLGAPNPMGVVGPVERYQGGQVRELPKKDFSPGGGSSGGGSSGGGS